MSGYRTVTSKSFSLVLSFLGGLVSDSSFGRLPDEAIKSLQQWRFKPAVKNGQIVAIRGQTSFDFSP
jgi:hypothetical protein